MNTKKDSPLVIKIRPSLRKNLYYFTGDFFLKLIKQFPDYRPKYSFPMVFITWLSPWPSSPTRWRGQPQRRNQYGHFDV